MTAAIVTVRHAALIGACGLLLCAAVTAMETLSEPLQDLPNREVRELVGSVAWTWLVNGMWWSVATSLLAHLPARRLAASIGPLASAVTLLHVGTWKLGFTFSLDGGSADLMGRAQQPAAIALHILWANTFFGGLYLMSFAGFRRAGRSRRLLNELVSNRAEVEAEQQEARLQTLRGQLQPGVVIEALELLQVSYAEAPAHGNAVFDKLVRFLRAAMPSVREQGVTLGSELALVGHYAELRRQTGAGGGAAVQEVPVDFIDIDFPALCLLPLIEMLACGVPPDAVLVVQPMAGIGWTGAEIDVPCGQQPLSSAVGADLERRLRLELAALHGPNAALTLHRRPYCTKVSIHLPLPLAAGCIPYFLPKEDDK